MGLGTKPSPGARPSPRRPPHRWPQHRWPASRWSRNPWVRRRAGQLKLPAEPRPAPPPPPALFGRRPSAARARARRAGAWATRRHRPLALGGIAVAVVAFSGLWPGDLVLDGPGVALYVQLVTDQLGELGRVSAWLPDLWAGTPAWILAPSLPVTMLAPLGMVLGADAAVKVAVLAAQVVGGWGALVLAESLWGRRPPLPFVAGLLYALHPMFVSHGALFGHETSVWVMAATPWLAWALRLALRGQGARYGVLAGFLAGFAVLQQAEHAYGLALLSAGQVAIELARAARSPRRSMGEVAARAGLVGAVALGATAFWLVPFATHSDEFILTPPETVRAVLDEGVGSEIGREPGTFLARSAPLEGSVTFERDLLRGSVYLGWVAVGLTGATLAVLSRRDRDGHLTAILVCGALGLWMSTAGVPLASSGPAERAETLPFLVIGAMTGLLVGSFMRRVVRSRTLLWGGLAVAFVLALPYLTPFLSLQRFVPFLASIRFPRLYPLGALAVSLGAAYPLRLAVEWASRHQPRHEALVAGALSLVLVGAFLLDARPYRSYYRASGPDDAAAYERLDAALAAAAPEGRVATASFGEPRLVRGLVATGVPLSVGWPHPIAGRQVWRLTGEAVIAPPGYQRAALGLAGTEYLAVESRRARADGTVTVASVNLRRNPRALPLVRAYNDVVVVADRSVTPELATALSARHVGVVQGDAGTAERLGPAVRGRIGSDACDEAGAGDLAQELAMACTLHNWLGVFAGYDGVPIGDATGAVVRSRADGLEGVAVWLDRAPAGSELVIYDLGPDGRTLSSEVRRSRLVAGAVDANGMALFRFDPIDDSAGRDYAFVLSCEDCEPAAEPRLVTSRESRLGGTLVTAEGLDADRSPAYALLYPGAADAPPPSTTVDGRRAGPGRWEVAVSGSAPALVVVAEAAGFDGWTARVDGRPAPVLEADGAFLGVAVGPGDHTVELAYHRPAATTVGRAITALTLLTLAGAGLVTWARRGDGAPDQAPSP